MRLAAGLFLATIIVAGAGVYFVNARVGGVDTGEELPPGRLKLSGDRPVQSVAAPVASSAKSTIYVSGCFDSGGECRCIDQKGRRIPLAELSHADCRVMLKIAPK